MTGVNLDGVFFLSQAAMPHLLASRGNIVNMASSAGLVDRPTMRSTALPRAQW